MSCTKASLLTLVLLLFGTFAAQGAMDNAIYCVIGYQPDCVKQVSYSPATIYLDT